MNYTSTGREIKRPLSMTRFVLFLLTTYLIFNAGLASGQDAFPTNQLPVRIGVLAKRGPEHCLRRWSATADYLSERIPGYAFSIRPLDFLEIKPAVNQQEVEFFLANPSFYVALEKQSGATRIATLKNLHIDGTSHKQYAGTIFCKVDRDDLQNLPDLRDKTFMAVDEYSLGGWHMAWREFLERGVDPHRDFSNLSFGGTHDAVVYAVRDGTVDAGTVRSDTLERMEIEGKIRMADFKVLSLHLKSDCEIPFVHSTRHYPEWPLAKSAHTPDELAELVARALIRMPTNSVAAVIAKCGWWTIPYNYQSVHECLKAIRYAPYEDYGKVLLQDAFRKYRFWLAGIFILVLLVFLLGIRMTHMRAGLRRAELVKTERDKLTSIFDSMKDGVFILSKAYDIQYVNPALVDEFGPGEGKKCHEYFNNIESLCATALHEEVFAGKTNHVEYTASQSGKTYDVLYTPLENADGTVSKLGILRDITERKQMEMVISHTNEVISHSPIVVFRQKRGKLKGFEYFSDNVVDLLGYTAADFMEERIGYDGLLVHPDDIDRTKAEFAVSAADENATMINYSPYRIITKNGEVKWVEDKTYIRRDAKGNIIRFEGIISDITERCQMEMAISHTNEIINRSPIVVFRRDDKISGDVEFISENAFDLTGYSAQEFMEEKIEYAEVIHPDDFQEYKRRSEMAFRNKDSNRIEFDPYRIIAKNGEVKWVEDRSYLRRDDQGNMTHVEGTIQDITARKRLEDEREQILRNTAKRVQELRCMQSVEASIGANEAIEAVVKEVAKQIPAGWQYPEIARARICFNEQEFVSEPFEETPWRQSAEFRVAGKKTIGEVEVFYLEERPELDEGPFLSEERNLIDFIANALGKAHGHRQAELDREKTESLLRQAQKMEAIGQLAGGVAHDFNNILQAMQGYVELMMMDLEKGTQLHDFAKEVLQESQRAAALTRQLLVFSRQECIEKRNLDINLLIDNLLKMLSRVLSERIDLKFTPAEQPLILHGDSGQLEQIILNLCVNARDAMSENGVLEIGTEMVVLDENFCETHPWAKPGHYAVLTVSDNGCGMTEETRVRIFEPFFTTKDISKGTGLGLATVYGIVNQHEGLIHVYSEIGHGTTFRVYLPCLHDGTVMKEDLNQPNMSIGGRETILLVEDDESVRRVTSRILRAAGYTLLQACDGTEGIEQVERFAKDIDLLVSDIVMPGKTGVEVMTCFHKHKPDGPVILMSGYVGTVLDSDQIDDSIRVIFIKKPFGSHELLRRVREQLNGNIDGAS